MIAGILGLGDPSERKFRPRSRVQILDQKRAIEDRSYTGSMNCLKSDSDIVEIWDPYAEKSAWKILDQHEPSGPWIKHFVDPYLTQIKTQ